MQKKLTFVISGPSGVGKGTICKRLAEEVDGIALSVSCTTRRPRPLQDGGMEVNGVHYHFITHETFGRMIEEGDFYEYAHVHDDFYGTSRSFVGKQKDAGNDVILEIDMQGALQVMQRRPDAITVFIAPPSFAELKRRLAGRGDTPPEVAARRLQVAAQECAVAKKYQYTIVNDDLQQAIAALEAILTAERCRSAYCDIDLKEEP